MIKEGEALTPNFWRAPTDNDFGAGLQKKYAAWKNPEMKLTSLNQRMENKQVIVEAVYDMPTVSAKLNLRISNTTAVVPWRIISTARVTRTWLFTARP